ncbi:MAG: GGDEF domain-containing protein [Hyphomonas sp.]
MQAVSARPTEPGTPPPQGQTLRTVFQNATKAFEYIQKYRTPPDPKTYSVWYTYAAGTDAALVDRVDHILSAKGTLAAEDIEAICEEMIVAAPSEMAQHNIGEAMEKEINDVLQIVQQSVQTSDDFHASLNAIGSSLPHAISGEELNRVMGQLVSENRRMAAKTLELRKGLTESQRQITTLNTELEEIQNQYMRDPLTSVANRRAFDKRLGQQVEQANRGGQGFCLAMADIDQFKKINDEHGHQAGDTVLKTFAHMVSQNIKGQDMVARVGGEEFAVILPQTDVVAAYNLLVKIKHHLKSTTMPVGENGEAISGVTASFGIARHEPGMTQSDIIRTADTYLYEAKNSGRDRVKAKGL